MSLKGCRLSRADAISAGAAADLCMLDMPPATTFAGLGSSRRSPRRRAKRRISCRKSQSTLLKRPWHRRRRRRRHRVLRAPRGHCRPTKKTGAFAGEMRVASSPASPDLVSQKLAGLPAASSRIFLKTRGPIHYFSSARTSLRESDNVHLKIVK